MYTSTCVLRYYQYLFMHVHNTLFTNNFHMANNLVKWWRNKFLGGYRQFSGIVTPDCSEGRPSDTEELLRQTASTRTASSQTVPSLKPVREGFSYDVSVEGGISHDGHERQEFSFTWYDFDGHGKITKDDIAGLVTTIYDTLGTSIKVPHYGSKTIKVRLTVSPGQRKEGCEKDTTTKIDNTVLCKDSTQDYSTNPSGLRIKRDINVTIRKARNLRRARRKIKLMHNEDRLCRDRSLDNNDGAADISDDAEDDGCSRLSHTDTLEKTPGCPAPFRGQNNFQHENMMRMRRIHKRSGSLQRQELLDIIQANMAKNNLGFQISSRKHLTNQSAGNDLIPNRRQRRFFKEQEHTSLQRTHTLSTNIPVDSEHCTSPKIVSHCCYDKMVDSIVRHKKNVLSSANFPLCSQENHCGTEKEKKCCDTSNLLKMHERTACPDNIFDNFSGYQKNGKFCSQQPVSEQQSPHHLKHRNRQENHARAMEQVVRWLEQEFSSNLKMGTTPTTGKTKPDNRQSGNQSSPQNKKGMTTVGNSVVEHHHVHEHIHHHYHHFQEPPILV